MTVQNICLRKESKLRKELLWLRNFTANGAVKTTLVFLVSQQDHVHIILMERNTSCMKVAKSPNIPVSIVGKNTLPFQV